MGNRLGSVVVVLMLVASVLAAGGVESAEAAVKRADLRVTRMSTPPASVVQGKSMRISVRVYNAGTKSTGRTTWTRFMLSKNLVHDPWDRFLRRIETRSLGAKRSVDLAPWVKVPPTTPAGKWRVLVCADTPNRVTENDESNNCRASSTVVTVKKRAAPATGPIDVTYTTATDQAKTQRMYGFGDTASTTAADGTKYELTMPIGSLISPVDVTLTPLSDIGGYPLTGAARAVEIKPHGLRLMKPARLVITPPAGTTLSNPVSFLFAEDGADFHRYPMAPGEGIAMDLMHFSTPGVGTGTAAQLDRLHSSVPADREAAYEGDVAEAVDQGGAAVRQTLERYRDNVVAPELDQALTNDAKAADAIAHALALERQAQLLGIEDLQPQLMEKIMAILRNALAAATNRCFEGHQIHEITRLVSMARQWSLLGYEADGEAILQRAMDCARFEVRFEATATESVQRPFTQQTVTGLDREGTWSLASTIPVAITPMTQQLTGRGTMASTGFAYRSVLTYHGSPDFCPSWQRVTTGTGTDPGVSSTLVDLDLNLYAPPDGGPMRVNSEQRFVVNTRSTALDIRADVPHVADRASERYHSEGGCQSPSADPTDDEESIALGTLASVHQDAGRTMPDLGSPDAVVGFDLDQFVVEFVAGDQSGDVLVARTFADVLSGPCGSGCTESRSATTTVRLVHTPQE